MNHVSREVPFKVAEGEILKHDIRNGLRVAVVTIHDEPALDGARISLKAAQTFHRRPKITQWATKRWILILILIWEEGERRKDTREGGEGD
jgi:hypothetical protein